MNVMYTAGLPINSAVQDTAVRALRSSDRYDEIVFSALFFQDKN